MEVLNTIASAMITLNIEMIKDITTWGMRASKVTCSINEWIDPQSLLLLMAIGCSLIVASLMYMENSIKCKIGLEHCSISRGYSINNSWFICTKVALYKFVETSDCSKASQSEFIEIGVFLGEQRLSWPFTKEIMQRIICHSDVAGFKILALPLD